MPDPIANDAPTEVTVTAKADKRDPNDVTLFVNGQELSGWENVEITLRVEGFPNSFAVSVSAKPGLNAKAGDECRVLMGNDPVITGYVDRDSETADARSHMISLLGRGKTQDLVDCSAEWEGGQIADSDALQIATKLAQPYGIAVELGEGASAGPKVPQFNVNYSETPAEIIQRVARNAGLIAFEDGDGKLILSSVGSKTAMSGIAYGKNVLRFNVENSIDGRFSNYVCMYFSVDPFQDIPGSNFFYQVNDLNVKRHRQLDIFVESGAVDIKAFTEKRARWEANRRAGRGNLVRATVDSWRDSGGKLWTPNTLIPVELPRNRGGTPLILTEVTFRRSNDNGTTADLVLMPKEGLSIEPISLQPIAAVDVAPAPAPAQ
ncbi:MULTISPECIES: phage baseplate assembly protein [Sphingomonas]|uniref:phage baseplate assembly protein n=1 Tax=Sphingomonas TaxID=13687 RepID=UPI000834CFDE|nr:contractile injection system protein, VgrG/Pvc8 family [Sphingomonas sp. CCH10-B3]